MNIPRICRRVGVGILIIGLCGCTYAVSKKYRQEADPELSYDKVKENPKAFAGAIVIWGGKIVDTVNHAGGTDLIVLEIPLENGEVPSGSVQESRGRYIARSGQFLDPEIYSRGKLITLAGEVDGQETRPLGQMQYTYPILLIRELHTWKIEWAYPPAYYSGFWGGWDYPFWPYGYGSVPGPAPYPYAPSAYGGWYGSSPYTWSYDESFKEER